MNRYFYTFGSDPGFPYHNGWVEVRAESWDKANQMFRAKFPDRHEGTLNCAFFYDEEQWKKMDPEHNWSGWKLHEVIEDTSPHEINMTYSTMRNYFRTAERAHQHLTGYIVFSPASFTKEYSVESRTYAVSSDNKAYQPNKGGYSIYASSLDGSDPCVRLEQYMAAEYGGKDGWQIERCYMLSDEVERAKALTRAEKEHER